MKRGELVKILKSNGCWLLRNGGNHEIWYSDKEQIKFQVPRHYKEIPTGTVHSILKDAGLK